jgi:hypothetical protein
MSHPALKATLPSRMVTRSGMPVIFACRRTEFRCEIDAGHSASEPVSHPPRRATGTAPNVQDVVRRLRIESCSQFFGGEDTSAVKVIDRSQSVGSDRRIRTIDGTQRRQRTLDNVCPGVMVLNARP